MPPSKPSPILLVGASALAIAIFLLPGGSLLLGLTLWKWQSFRQILLNGFPKARDFLLKLMDEVARRMKS